MNEAGKGAEAIRAALAEINRVFDKEKVCHCDCAVVRKHLEMAKRIIVDMPDKGKAIKIAEVIIGALRILPTGVVETPHFLSKLGAAIQGPSPISHSG